MHKHHIPRLHALKMQDLNRKHNPPATDKMHARAQRLRPVGGPTPLASRQHARHAARWVAFVPTLPLLAGFPYTNP